MVVVVEGGNILHHVKGRGNCPGGICPEGKCPDPGPHTSAMPWCAIHYSRLIKHDLLSSSWMRQDVGLRDGRQQVPEWNSDDGPAHHGEVEMRRSRNLMSDIDIL